MGCYNSKNSTQTRRFSLNFGNKNKPEKKYGINPENLPERTIFSYDLNHELNNMKDIHDFPYEGDDMII